MLQCLCGRSLRSSNSLSGEKMFFPEPQDAADAPMPPPLPPPGSLRLPLLYSALSAVGGRHSPLGRENGPAARSVFGGVFLFVWLGIFCPPRPNP